MSTNDLCHLLPFSAHCMQRESTHRIQQSIRTETEERAGAFPLNSGQFDLPTSEIDLIFALTARKNTWHRRTRYKITMPTPMEVSSPPPGIDTAACTSLSLDHKLPSLPPVVLHSPVCLPVALAHMRRTDDWIAAIKPKMLLKISNWLRVRLWIRPPIVTWGENGSLAAPIVILYYPNSDNPNMKYSYSELITLLVYD